jgi:hypothetical protein
VLVFGWWKKKMGELILTSIVRRVFAVWLPWKKRGSKRGIEEGFPWSCGCGAFSGRVEGSSEITGSLFVHILVWKVVVNKDFCGGTMYPVSIS